MVCFIWLAIVVQRTTVVSAIDRGRVVANIERRQQTSNGACIILSMAVVMHDMLLTHRRPNATRPTAHRQCMHAVVLCCVRGDILWNQINSIPFSIILSDTSVYLWLRFRKGAKRTAVHTAPTVICNITSTNILHCMWLMPIGIVEMIPMLPYWEKEILAQLMLVLRILCMTYFHIITYNDRV